MKPNTSLADLLEEYMTEHDIGDARLATLANDAIRRPDYIHRSTIRNWRTGTSKTVKDWRQLVAISSALRLDEEAATQLLLTGGCASIRDLRATARDDEKHLFALWPEKSKPVVTAEKPNVALATEHSAALDTEMAAQETEPARATSPFPLSFRIAAISALTGLLLIVALGFILNRPTEEPTPPTDPDLAEATEAEATETESTASSDSSDDASADESSPDESSADDVSHIDTVDPDTPIITIYDDSLRNGWGWQEGSSNTEAKVQSSEIVYAGEFALCTTIMEYGALALRPIEPLPVTPDHHIEFQIHGTDSISGDLVFFVNNEEGPEGHTLTTIDLAGKYIEGGRVDETSWRAVSIPLRDVGFDGEIVTTLTEINIHSAYAGEVPTIFLDDIQIVDAAHARKINNPADGRYIVYRDKMHPLWSWSDSSWNAAIDDADTAGESYSGEFAIRVDLQEFGLLGFFTAPPIPIEPDQWLEFQLLGEDPGGQQLVLSIDNDFDFDNNASQRVDLYDNQYIEDGGNLDHTKWQKISVPLSDFVIDEAPVTEVSLIMIHSPFQGETPTFWIDDVQIVSDP